MVRADEVMGLLLAAGRGRRFGSDKLNHRLPDGTPMALASAHQLLKGCGPTLAVLRPDQTTLCEWLQEAGVRVLMAPEAGLGMGHSLAAAVRATPRAKAWVVALGDMPWVQVDTIRSVANAVRSGADMVAPLFEGQRGHPVGWSSRWFAALGALKGDQGARDILQEHRAMLTRIDTLDAGVLRDVDTPDALNQGIR